MASRFLRAAVAIALLAWAAPSWAEPSAAEKETARSLMAEGRVRRDRKDVRGALESFRAADAIMHVPTTGLEVARTQVALGRLVEAADSLRAVLHLPASPADPPPFLAARAAAQSLLADVLARMPSIRVAPESKDGVRVAIDDAAIPAEALGEPFKVDPGHHVVRVTQRGSTTTREVDVSERETKVVTIDAPPDGAAAAIAPAPEPPPPSDAPASSPPTSDAPAEPTAPDSPPAESPHTMRTVAWAGVAIAGAGVVAGSIAGLLSLSHTSDAKAQCNGDHCPPSAAPDIDAAHTTGRISTIAFAVAGAGAAMAIVGFVIGDRPPDAAPNRGAGVVPWIGLGAAGARVTF